MEDKQIAISGESFSQAQALESQQMTSEAGKRPDYFNCAKELILPSDIIDQRGYITEEPAPQPEVCEYCGRNLYYFVYINYWKRDRIGRNLPPSVMRWTESPQRCECPDAVAKWRDYDEEHEREKLKRGRQEKETQYKIHLELAFGKSGLKKRFISRTFQSFDIDSANKRAAYNTAKSYADSFSQHLETGHGLYIEGTFGTGKTHLAAAIAHQLIKAGYNVIFKTADDLFREIKITFNDGGGADSKVINRYKSCDLLIIDDLGQEQATEWTTSILYAIINDRYEAMKPIIITTNFNESNLIMAETPKGVGDHRIRAILSRIHETTSLLTMAWPDWRSSETII